MRTAVKMHAAVKIRPAVKTRAAVKTLPPRRENTKPPSMCAVGSGYSLMYFYCPTTSRQPVTAARPQSLLGVPLLLLRFVVLFLFPFISPPG